MFARRLLSRKVCWERICFPFRLEFFSESGWFTEKQTGSLKSCLPCQKCYPPPPPPPPHTQKKKNLTSLSIHIYSSFTFKLLFIYQTVSFHLYSLYYTHCLIFTTRWAHMSTFRWMLICLYSRAAQNVERTLFQRCMPAGTFTLNIGTLQRLAIPILNFECRFYYLSITITCLFKYI